jgi:hypothetical protein
MIRTAQVLRFTPAAVAIVTTLALAQSPNGAPALRLTATAGDSQIRIDLLRWSTDAERDQLIAAWTQPGAAGRGPGGRGGRPTPAFDPFGAGNDDAAQAALARGAAARGGNGGGRPGGRGGDAEAPPPTPEAALATALREAPAVGYLWSSSEVAGYSLRYAVRLAQPDGERILLVTDRRLGAWTGAWKVPGTPTDYDFTVLELRLNPKGEGEGKASLTGKVSVDATAKTIALAEYAASPVVLRSLRRRSN